MGKGLDTLLSLANLLPVVGDTASSDSHFPGSLTCVDSLDGAVREVFGLCACLLAGGCSVLVMEEMLPSETLECMNLCVHFCLWHTGNKAFYFPSEEWAKAS